MLLRVSRAWFFLHVAQYGGFRIKGKRWRAAWLGPEAVDRKALERLIQETYEQVTRFLSDNFDMSPRRMVTLICGGQDRIRSAIREDAHRPSGSAARIGSCFWAPDTIVIVSHPEQPNFKAIVAHELAHAIGYQACGGLHVQPWIGEGMACLVAREVTDVDYAWHFLFAFAHDPDGFQLPIPLRTLLQPTQTLADDAAQSMLTGQTAAFVAFLWQMRATNDGPWNAARRAFAGREPETTLPVRALEEAFDLSLDQIEQEFINFCRLLLRDYQTRSLSWSKQAFDVPPKIN